jgi:hypothetical protein
MAVKKKLHLYKVDMEILRVIFKHGANTCPPNWRMTDHEPVINIPMD